jgi:hypothetical protein
MILDRKEAGTSLITLPSASQSTDVQDFTMSDDAIFHVRLDNPPSTINY